MAIDKNDSTEAFLAALAKVEMIVNTDHFECEKDVAAKKYGTIIFWCNLSIINYSLRNNPIIRFVKSNLLLFTLGKRTKQRFKVL